jgi:hypothetical protein
MGGGPAAGVGLILGVALVCFGTPILGLATFFLTRGVKTGRRKIIVTASLFPLACIGWAVLVLLFQGTVNENLLRRDAGFGDLWACPLSDGYGIEGIDDPDVGVLYNLKTQKTRNVSWGTGIEDAIGGVRRLQIAGAYILGAVNTHFEDGSGLDQNQVDSYFLLDTHTGKHTSFSSYDALRSAARDSGIDLKLEGISEVYSRYRFTWFEVFTNIMFFVPPLLALWLLVRSIIRLRRTLRVVPQLS